MVAFEFLVYLSIWFYMVVKCCYETYSLAYGQNFENYKQRNLLIKDIFGLYRSVYEYSWKEIVILSIDGSLFFVVYLFISKFLRKYTSPMVFMLGCTMLTISFHLYLSSLEFVALECLILLIAVILGICRWKYLVWICQLAILYNLGWFSNIEFFDSSYLFYTAYAYLALLITRAISVGLLLADKSNKSKLSLQSLVECFYFYWYFPAMIGCRMMTIRDFIKQIYEPYKISNRSQWAFKLIKCTIIAIPLWHIVVLLCPHYLVLMSMHIKDLNPFIYTSGQMFHGIHFYMVYYILYNTVYCLCQFDGYETTTGPVCVPRVSVFSVIWREFDRGLYVWNKDHIYKPILRYRSTLIYQIIAVLSSFGFVYIFHGVNVNIGVFIGFNVFQYLSEMLVKYIYNDTIVGKEMDSRFSKAALRRLEGIICTVSFIISSIAFGSMQYSFNKMYMILSHMVSQALYNANYKPLGIYLLFVYCHGQISVFVKHMRQIKNVD